MLWVRQRLQHVEHQVRQHSDGARRRRLLLLLLAVVAAARRWLLLLQLRAIAAAAARLRLQLLGAPLQLLQAAEDEQQAAWGVGLRACVRVSGARSA